MLSRKFYLATKLTKDTKVSDIVIYKLLNFVLFVTFVIKVVFFFACGFATLGLRGEKAISALNRRVINWQI
jgi:hypothetical protein